MNTIEEWKKDFREYIDGLYLLNDDYKGVMEYIDEVPTVETDIEVIAKDAYKQGYTDGWKERYGEPNERPRGEWIATQVIGISDITLTCSNCKDEFIGDNDLDTWKSVYHYCPSCGADMRGKHE